MSRIIQPVSDSDAVTLQADHKQPPSSITGECQKCGKCCVFYKCSLVDTETGRCPIWKNRPVACRIWPTRLSNISEIGCPGFHQTGL